VDEKQTSGIPLFGKREEFLQGLERFLPAVDTSGSCSIEINASWGYGKTTFIHHAEKELRGKGFGVLHYNAWENDYETDPLDSIY